MPYDVGAVKETYQLKSVQDDLFDDSECDSTERHHVSVPVSFAYVQQRSLTTDSRPLRGAG